MDEFSALVVAITVLAAATICTLIWCYSGLVVRFFARKFPSIPLASDPEYREATSGRNYALTGLPREASLPQRADSSDSERQPEGDDPHDSPEPSSPMTYHFTN